MIWRRILTIALEEELKVLCFMAELLLFCLARLFLHFLTSLIKLLFGIQGKSKWLKLFYKKDQGTQGICSWEGPAGSCLVSALSLPAYVSLDVMLYAMHAITQHSQVAQW